MAYGFNPFAVTRVNAGGSSTLLHAFGTFEQAMLYARSKARDGSQIDVLDCSDPNNCVALAVGVGSRDEYVAQAGMSYLENPAHGYLENPLKRKSFGPGNITRKPKEAPAGTYEVFGFTSHPGFTVVAVEPSGQQHLIELFPTFGQAMYLGRSLAHEASQHGEMIAVLGCLEGQCGVPLVIDVGTARERHFSSSRQFVANPAKRQQPTGSRGPAGSYPIFGFNYPQFSVTIVDADSRRTEPVTHHATFGQAMLYARGLARDLDPHEMVMVFGCIDNRCGVPIAMHVGTAHEQIMPWAQAYVSNPVTGPSQRWRDAEATVRAAAATKGITVIGAFSRGRPADPLFEVLLTAPPGFCFEIDLHEYVLEGESVAEVWQAASRRLAEITEVHRCEEPGCEWCADTLNTVE